MAEKSHITLPGGSEAARFATPPATRAVPSTPVEKAFLALDEALAEAGAAIARLDDPMSDDPAHAAILADDLKALEAALVEADRVVSHASLVITDRALITASHFIASTIRLETAHDRRTVIGTLRRTHPIFAVPERGRNAVRVAAMINRALDRLTYVVDALDALEDGRAASCGADQDLVF